MPDDAVSIREYCERLFHEQERQFDIHVEGIKKALCACRSRERETLESMREFFESKIQAIETATKIAYETMERRLEGMNEFRDTLRDQAGKFVTRSEIDVVREAIEDDLRILRESKANLEGKASQGAVNVALLFSVIGLLLGIFGIVMKFL
jgi:hypothetical protein